MPGFSRGEQQCMALLVRGHRRKFPLAELESLAEEDGEVVRRLCILLRLAVVLHRSRVDYELPSMKLEADGDTLRLRFPDEWLDAHPLTAADLDVEADYLRAADVKFKYR